MQILTEAEIKEDIQAFRDRIKQAELKLAGLPAGRLPYPDHKKRERQRQAFKQDVEHVKGLIRIAESAL